MTTPLTAAGSRLTEFRAFVRRHHPDVGGDPRQGEERLELLPEVDGLPRVEHDRTRCPRVPGPGAEGFVRPRRQPVEPGVAPHEHGVRRGERLAGREHDLARAQEFPGAEHRPGLDQQWTQTRLGKVGGSDQPVVPSPDDNDVVCAR